MKSVRLGRTGLTVSELCFGTMSFGGDADEAEAISQGRWLDPIGISGVYAAIDPSGHAIALLQEKGKRASSVMVVRPATLRGLSS